MAECQAGQGILPRMDYRKFRWFNKSPGVSARRSDGCCIPSPPEFPKLARMSGRPKYDSRFARVMAT
ncbi:MAG TPA: hypothetical protein VF430_07445 [Verrucomicrobiae bacterium]